MRNNFKPILISLLIIIFLLAVTSFIYREEIWDYLSLESEIGLEEVVYSPKVLLSDTIDLEILKSETLNSLERQVNSFNYNNICDRPAITIQTSEGLVSQIQFNCSVGNRVPFAPGEK